MTRERQLLPGEQPYPVGWLQEKLEGKQLARLQYLGEMPDGGEALGMEFTDYTRYLVWPVHDASERTSYKWRLIWREIPAQKIITPRMVKHYRDERKNEVGGPKPQDDLQEFFEGEIIIGVLPPPPPNAFGGEICNIEFRGGFRLHLEAVPPLPRSTNLADLIVLPDFPRSRAIVTQTNPVLR